MKQTLQTNQPPPQRQFRLDSESFKVFFALVPG